MRPEFPPESPVEPEDETKPYPLTVEVFPTTEGTAAAVAARLLDRVSQHGTEMKIGLSHGSALEPVMDSFVTAIRDKIQNGEMVDLSNVQFIQLEALFPESSHSRVNRFAHTLETRLVQPLRDLGLTINMYYPGESGKSLEETLIEYKDLVANLDLDLVSVNTSGDARALRDADLIEGEPRYVLGLPGNLDVAVRQIKNTGYDPQTAELGGKKWLRPAGDVSSQELFTRLVDKTATAISSGDTVTQMPEALLTAGIRTSTRAKEVWIVAVGEQKGPAVARMFKHLAIEGVPDQSRRQRLRERRSDQEGTTSTAAIIQARLGQNTALFVDNQAARDSDLAQLEADGAQVVRHE